MLMLRSLSLGLVLLVLMVGASIPARAQGVDEPLILDDPQTSYPLGLHLEYLEDPGGNLTFEDVIGPEFTSRFTPSQEETPNLGFDQSAAYWIRFHVRNETSQVSDWLLSFSDARVGLIDLYYQPHGRTDWVLSQAGRFRPATVREYAHPNFVFPLSILPSDEATVYLRLQGGSIRFSLSLWPAKLFEQQNHTFFLALGLVYGIIGIMAVYNLTIFLFLRQTSYLYYVLFITANALNMACIDGTAYVYLFPNWGYSYTQGYTSILATIFSVVFVREFLELKRRLPWLDRALISLAALSGSLIPAMLFSVTGTGFLFGIIPIAVKMLTILGAFLTWRQGLRAAGLFLFAWGGLLLNVIFRQLSILDFIPSSPLFDWHYYLSNVWMVAFLSLALADQINTLKAKEMQAAAAMQESENKYRTLVEQANDGIIVIQEGKIIFINSFTEKMSGYSAEELKNTSFISYIAEDEQPKIFEFYKRRIAGEDLPAIYETAFKRKDGSRMEVEVNAGMTTYDGKPSDMVIVRDITERKWMEAQRESVLEELDESERKYRTLIEHANDGVAVIQDEKIVFANLPLAKILGCTSESLKNTPFKEYLPAEQHSFINDAYQQREEKNTPSIYESVVQRQDGTRVTVEFSTSLTTYAGEPAVLVFVRDITERKNYEAELRRYNERLEELVTERTRDLELSRARLNILNQSSQMINMAGLDSEQVYVAIRAACAWLVPADAVAISLVDHAAGEVEDVYLMDRNQRLPWNSYPLQGSFVGDVLKDGASLRVDDFQAGSNGAQQANWLTYFPDARAGLAVLLRGSKENLGLLTVHSYAPNAYNEDHQSILESFASHASITLENIHHYKQLERTAVIEERQRLASELHDSVTQLLYSMALMSGGWRLKASQDQLPNPAEYFRQIEELSLQALKEMRMLIYQLHPPILAAVGLLNALEERLDKVERRVHVEAHLHVEERFPTLSALVEEEIYFIILEALNNSLRHARATAVNINIRTQENELHITVEDNGRGYDTSVPSKGMGTAILNNRAAAIGARLTRDSQLGQGTRVDLVVEI